MGALEKNTQFLFLPCGGARQEWRNAAGMTQPEFLSHFCNWCVTFVGSLPLWAV